LVIICAGIVGWLLILAVTLCLGAAAKRGDELEQDAQRYLPDPHFGAKIIPFRRNQSGRDDPSASCGRRRCR
jgi:hypothetical protein